MLARSLETGSEPLAQLVGESAVMRHLRALLRRIANTDTTVLLLGESGTGKELVAQAVHALSARRRSKVVPINCGAIPPDLLESELFGHRKGAFTGAYDDRKGRFELADSGTLFLDEIGDMRLEMQVKLLRVLQERAIDRVGEDESRPVDVRIVAATHRNLHEAVDAGLFRADLFYRLNVFPLPVPALRERGQDVLLLFGHFAQRCALPGFKPVTAAEDLQQWMLAHPWPGNCRELLNFVERLSVLWPGTEVPLKRIPRSMLPRGTANLASVPPDLDSAEREAVLHLADMDEPLLQDALQEELLQSEHQLQDGGTTHAAGLINAADVPRIPANGIDLRQTLADYEGSLIREAMARCDGNITHAADLLRMRRTTFLERLRKLAPSDFRD